MLYTCPECATDGWKKYEIINGKCPICQEDEECIEYFEDEECTERMTARDYRIINNHTYDELNCALTNER